MSILQEFQFSIPKAEGDNGVLQNAFLHHLFPDTVRLSDVLAQRSLIQYDSYKLVAADGWLALQGDAAARIRFELGMVGVLNAAVLPEDLPYHRPALLGLALGCRRFGLMLDARAWWHSLLTHVRREEPRMAYLLEVVLGWTSVQPPSDGLEVYALAAGLLEPEKPFWEAGAMARFLHAQRKCHFPYAEDFFENMLRVYVMDFAMEICLRYETVLLPGLAQQIHSALEQLALRQATRQTIAVTVLIYVWMIAACYFLFGKGEVALDLRARWDEVGWVFLWLSGPVSAFVSMFRLIFFAITRRSLDLDFVKVRDRWSGFLLRRWRPLLKLPFSTDSPA